MTRARQLELVPLAPSPTYGTPLLAVRLEGKPQRSKQMPVLRGGRVTMIPDPRWKAWRDSMVIELRNLAFEHGLQEITRPVLAGVEAVWPRPDSPRTMYTLDKVTRPYPFAWVSGRIPYIGDPDHDQVTKAAVDVVKQADLLADDTLVVGYGESHRWYAAEGEDAHVEVRLWSAG